MRAELKSIHLLDEWDSLQSGEEFYSNLEIELGPTGVNSSDLFNINVCNKHWILKNSAQHNAMFLERMIICEDFSEPFLASIISKKIAAINADDWQQLAKKLAIIFHWEYQDYISY